MQIIEVKNQLVSTIALIDDENQILIGKIPVGKTLVENDSVEVKLFSDPNQLSFVNVQLIELKKEF